MDKTILDQLIGTGLAGVIIAVIVVPTFRWMQRQIENKDSHLKNLIENHYAADQIMKQELNQTLSRQTETLGKFSIAIELLPQKTLDRLTTRTAKKILRKR